MVRQSQIRNSVVGVSILLILMLSALHAGVIAWQKRNNSQNLIHAVEDMVLSGDRSRAFHLLSSRVGSNKLFVSIYYFDHISRKGIYVGDRYGLEKKRSNSILAPVLYSSDKVELFFDAEQTIPASYFVTTFSHFDGFQYTLATWFIFVLVLILTSRRIESRIKRNHIREIEFTRLSALANATANIAHDLRSPLGVFQDLLAKEEIPENVRARANSALNRVYTMIEAFRNSDVDRIVKRSYCTIDFESLVLEAATGARTQIALSNELTHRTVRVDVAKIERIILNLLKNACEAGAKTCSLNVRTKDEALVLEVIDDGCGIPEAIADKIFERGVTFGKKGGTGLGLSYVQDVAHGHGGEVIYCREGDHSIFRVTLPDSIYAEHPPTNSGRVSRIDEPSTPTRKLTVLIALKDKAFQDRLVKELHNFPEIHYTLDEAEAPNVALIYSDKDEVSLSGLKGGALPQIVDPNKPLELIVSSLRIKIQAISQRFMQLNDHSPQNE